MTQKALTPVATGLAFGEGPRWHDDRLWFSDMHAHRVMTMDTEGHLSTVVEVETQPSGLGWDTEGRLLVVSMTDRRLVRLEDGALVEVADLSGIATWHCNDMVVDRFGRAYIGNFGWDIYQRGADPVPASLILVGVDGAVSVAAPDLQFPNGTVITPDGSTLIVGESYGFRLTAFDVADDGTLHNRRVWAQLTDATPDGICLDAEGATWIASPMGHQVVRVGAGGVILERIPTGDREAYACMLGGPDRTTLYVCTAFDSSPNRCREQMAGRIEAIEVDVPGAGWP
jgi:YD repeat-containing protein